MKNTALSLLLLTSLSCLAMACSSDEAGPADGGAAGNGGSGGAAGNGGTAGDASTDGGAGSNGGLSDAGVPLDAEAYCEDVSDKLAEPCTGLIEIPTIEQCVGLMTFGEEACVGATTALFTCVISGIDQGDNCLTSGIRCATLAQEAEKICGGLLDGGAP